MPNRLDIAAGTGAVRALLHASTDAAVTRPEQWPSLLKTTYSMVLDARVAMYIAWGDELRMFYNDAYIPVLGAKHPAALGCPLWMVWPELEAGFVDIIDAARAGTPAYFENVELTLFRNGVAEAAWFTLSIAPIRDEDGSVPGVWVTVLETTEQILAERRRTTELGYLKNLFEEAPGFIAIVHGPDHIFKLANRAYLRITGGRELLDKPFRAALPELGAQGYFTLLDQVYASGQPHVAHGMPAILEQPGQAGSEEHFIDFVCQPMVDASGATTGIFIEGSDVTEQYRAQQELERKVLALHDADRLKDEFLAMLAHELRNPLAPISAAADLLQLGQLDAKRIRQTSAVIGRQVRHMTSLVDDLLDVARVTRGHVELDITPQDMDRLVADAVEQATPLIRARQHHLALVAEAGPGFILGDHKRLVQVIANLLNNAAKYTRDGGHIVLRTRVQGPHAIIEIADNGMGMTPAFAARAFDLFVQAERTSDRTLGGLGLGLALVKKLVELHGGAITCTSPGLGQGSTFTVALPRVQTPAAPGAAVMAEGSSAASVALRILVVDDNVDAAAMLALLLGASGHTASTEYTAESALARARAEQPQVCLLDIGLPDMDGYEMAQRLRAAEGTAHCVLIAVTGYGQEEDRRQALAAGFDHHLVKPVDFEQLHAILGSIAVS